MEKKNTILVKDHTIRTIKVDAIEFIYTTDIARQKNQTEPKDANKN